MSEDRVVFTVAEAAELLGISKGTAYEYVRTGQLPAVRLGRRLVIPKHRFDELLNGEAA